MKILEITEGLNRNGSPYNSVVRGCGLFQIGAQNFPGTAGKHGRQFSVVHEIDAALSLDYFSRYLKILSKSLYTIYSV